MPTEEQINAANVELQIANDNYAALANKYNRYQEAFKTYANATPEQQERARWAMQNLLNSYNQLRLDMYAAEDRINQAQSAINNLNTYVAPQSPSRGGGQRRRQVIPQNEFGWEWWFEQWGVRYSPDWTTKVYPNWSIEFGESPIVYRNEWPYVQQSRKDFQYWSVPWFKEYNDYANAFANWGTRWMTNYLRGLPNPTTHPQYTTSLYNDMIRNWVGRQQADDFIRNWVEAHTP